MGRKKDQRVRKRRRALEKTWDLIATKSLLIADPRVLCADVRLTLGKLNIPWSANNRNRYIAAMHRAVGADNCRSLLIWSGTKTGRWSACPSKPYDYATLEARVLAMTGVPEWLKTSSVNVPSLERLRTLYGTATPSSPAGKSSQEESSE